MHPVYVFKYDITNKYLYESDKEGLTMAKGANNKYPYGPTGVKVLGKTSTGASFTGYIKEQIGNKYYKVVDINTGIEHTIKKVNTFQSTTVVTALQELQNEQFIIPYFLDNTNFVVVTKIMERLVHTTNGTFAFSVTNDAGSVKGMPTTINTGSTGPVYFTVLSPVTQALVS